MICDNCKRFFVAGNDRDGIPNGVKFVMKDGKSITMCGKCLIRLGEMTDKEKDTFFETLKDKKGID